MRVVSRRHGAIGVIERTIVDILDEVLDGELTASAAAKLSPVEIEQLAELVNQLYASWSPPDDPANDDLSIYSGGWIARGFLGHGHQYLLTSLLYAPSVVIHDPVAEWFDRDRRNLSGLPGIPSAQRNTGGGPAMIVGADEATLLKGNGYYVGDDRVERSRQYLGEVIPALGELAPLIRAGVVRPIPEVKLLHSLTNELHSAVRADVRDNGLRVKISELVTAGTPPARSNLIRGLEIEPTGGVAPGHEARAIVQNPAFYFEKTLALADASRARYIAPAAADAAMLEYRLAQLGVRLAAKTNSNMELRLMPALVGSELPFFADLDARLLLRIREDESAFEAWRAELRTVVRTIEAMPSDGPEFEQEARDVLSDELLPRAEAVRRAVSTSVAMRAAAKDTIADFAISVAAIGYAALGFGPAGAAVGAAVAAVGLPLRWAYRVVFRESPSGANGVLAQLVQRS